MNEKNTKRDDRNTDSRVNVKRNSTIEQDFAANIGSIPEVGSKELEQRRLENEKFANSVLKGTKE